MDTNLTVTELAKRPLVLVFLFCVWAGYCFCNEVKTPDESEMSKEEPSTLKEEAGKKKAAVV